MTISARTDRLMTMSARQQVLDPIRGRRMLAEFALLSLLAAAEIGLAMDWTAVSPLRPLHLAGPGLTLLAFTLLWWRARRPVQVFAAVCVIYVASTTLPFYYPAIGILVALYAVAARRSTRTSLTAMAVVDLVMALITARSWEDGVYEQAWVTVLLWWTFTLLVWLVAWKSNAHARTVEDLEQRRVAAAAAAVEAERVRLARELHDIVSHAVSGMVLQAAGARRVLGTDPVLAERAMGAVEELGHEAMGELRRLLGVLRTTTGEDTAPDADAPGLDDLGTLIQHVQDSGLRATLTVEGTPGTLAPSVDLTAYRIVQEALTNTMKHAGPGAQARIGLRWTAPAADPAPSASSALPTLAIEVADEGSTGDHRPTGDQHSGLGLIGLAERVAAIGGRFDARPQGHGFLVTATLPAAGGRVDITLPDESAVTADSSAPARLP